MNGFVLLALTLRPVPLRRPPSLEALAARDPCPSSAVARIMQHLICVQRNPDLHFVHQALKKNPRVGAAR